jgi:hypothetical protein
MREMEGWGTITGFIIGGKIFLDSTELVNWINGRITEKRRELEPLNCSDPDDSYCCNEIEGYIEALSDVLREFEKGATDDND